MGFFPIVLFLMGYTIRASRDYCLSRRQSVAKYNKKMESERLDKHEEAFIKKPANLPYKSVSKVRSPVFKIARKAFRSVSPIIASLTVPGIENVLGIVNSGYVKIANQIAIIMQVALNNIQSILNSYTTNISGEIETIINDSNKFISQKINASFKQAINTITSGVSNATTSIVDLSEDNMTTENLLLVRKITKRLSDTEDAIEGITNSGATALFAEVQDLLLAANKKVYDDIVTILDDNKNKVSIIPQLTYADPKYIASKVLIESDNMLESLGFLVNSALVDIKAYVKAAEASATATEKTILNSGNNLIVEIINNAVEKSLNEIKTEIKIVTENEIKQVEEAINRSTTTGLHDVIQDIMSNISVDIKKVVDDVTNSQIPELEAAILSNNNIVKVQVDTILAV